eukprot:CAMPEP_0170595606 /NCGR_PEP_ID=MMETSP0224-20130122/14656_1 /TAXON_ID=285029 /ORGANISM="Togula jolla, Strain CCCM 725" /LENGTH=166 /DNA_ID=CAMNT_0010919807 /DNA_START=99 /DNA_END=600 /DNA_ORIENTATION=+
MSPAARDSLLLWPADEAPQRASAGEPLDIDTIWNQPAKALPLRIVVLGEAREAPTTGHVDLLTSRELELSAPKGFHCNGALLLFGANGHEDLANVHASGRPIALAPCSTHASLKAICPCARKHLIDPKHLVGMGSHSEMKEALPALETMYLFAAMRAASSASLEIC